MLKIDSILCPVDFSEFSARAYDYAQSLAQQYKARLLLVHSPRPLFFAYPSFAYTDVVHGIYRDLRAHAELELQKFVDSHTHNGIQIECKVTDGPATDDILTFAEQQDVNLIVMGTHGRRGLDHLVLGSVTEKVLRKAKCPVLVVRKPVHEFVAPENTQALINLRKILFATDFSEHSERGLDYALSLAQEYNAELTLLHVLEDIPASEDLASATGDAMQRLEELVPSEPRNWCAIQAKVRLGRPHQEIIQLSLEAQTDLVILGVRGRHAVDLALFGSTSHRVIQLGPCPVLAVHISN